MRNAFSLAVLSAVVSALPVPAPAADTLGQTQTDPPRIIFAVGPAVLVRIDGEPVYRHVPGTDLDRIVNTKLLILRDPLGGHYLRILDGWMETYSLEDSWSISGVPPAGAGVALRQAAASRDVDLLDPATVQFADDRTTLVNQVPMIYISTVPAVLIVTNGPPRLVPVAGTSLKYMENATTKVFLEPTDRQLYLLLSGRWFRSWTQEGPWQFVPSDRLPGDFAKIPASLLSSPPRR